MRWTELPTRVLSRLRAGAVIPQQPLALDPDRRFDPRRQRALSRYYLAAGAGGLAVGGRLTQPGVREAGLYGPVLETAAAVAQGEGGADCLLIAGLAGRTEAALAEADQARGLGYHAGLLDFAALDGADEDDILDHCRQLAARIPLVGHYLAPALGGIALGRGFWRRFAELENVVAIVLAPFDRHRTLDAVAGVVAAQAEERVTLYTGNDDHILLDLVTPFSLPRDGGFVEIRLRGGVLGHWSLWTKTACGVFERSRAAKAHGPVSRDFLALDSQITDCSGAILDAAHGFRGYVAGIAEVLRRQGLLEDARCLDPRQRLSPGQREEIDRVYAAYPHLNDDTFVAANRARWLEG